MTVRQIWEGLLTELSKVNAPSMLLQDFNYFINKAICQYINKRYNIYDISQQTTDDLRVLKATTILKPTKVTENADYHNSYGGINSFDWKLSEATYEVFLPLDYLHMLNCICVYKLNKRWKCYDKDDYVLFAAKRLTADAWSIVVNDYYNRPLPYRPYFYINNVNTSNELPTNPMDDCHTKNPLERTRLGTDSDTDYTYGIRLIDPEAELHTNLPREIDISKFDNKSIVEREAGARYGNPSSVRLEIRYGKDDSVFELVGVMIDYIKSPLTIRLTLTQVDLTTDTSLIMEFPDYVCNEIINELVMLVMENVADPRLKTNPIVTQSIVNPAQQLPQQ